MLEEKKITFKVTGDMEAEFAGLKIISGGLPTTTDVYFKVDGKWRMIENLGALSFKISADNLTEFTMTLIETPSEFLLDEDVEVVELKGEAQKEG